MPRQGGADDVVWIDAECCFAYHGAIACCCLLACLAAIIAADASHHAVVNCWDDPENPDRCVMTDSLSRVVFASPAFPRC
jgi:hypothetical protein